MAMPFFYLSACTLKVFLVLVNFLSPLLSFSSSCPPIHASYSIVYDFEDEYDDMDDVLSSDCDDTASDCSEDDDSN